MRKTLLSKESIFVFLLIAISGLIHAYNMFNFPNYIGDEGTYISQAWSLLKLGRLSPYTYWYDHAPLGWMILAVWAKLTGGLFAFGFSINSGRALMLILHIFSVYFSYLISKKLTKNKIASYMASLIYAISPLAVFYSRMVLLDNIMIFWLLFSLVILLYKRNIVLSAIFFALAVLSKESAIILFPAFIYFVYHLSLEEKKDKNLALLLVTFFGIILIYPLAALIRGELNLLVEAFRFQVTRSGGSSLFDPQNDFFRSLRTWIEIDPVIILLGIVSTAITIFVGIRNKYALAVSLFPFSYIFYLFRGGIVLDFYIIPLFAFFTITLAYLLNEVTTLIQKINNTSIKRTIELTTLAFITLYVYTALFLFSKNITNQFNLFKTNHTESQIQATTWMLENTKPGDFVIVDNYALVELKEFGQGRNFEWYWKVEMENYIKNNILQNSPQNIDYIMLTPGMRADLEKRSELPIQREALKNSQQIKEFISEGSYVRIYQNNSN